MLCVLYVHFLDFYCFSYQGGPHPNTFGGKYKISFVLLHLLVFSQSCFEKCIFLSQSLISNCFIVIVILNSQMFTVVVHWMYHLSKDVTNYQIPPFTPIYTLMFSGETFISQQQQQYHLRARSNPQDSLQHNHPLPPPPQQLQQQAPVYYQPQHRAQGPPPPHHLQLIPGQNPQQIRALVPPPNQVKTFIKIILEVLPLN